MSQFPVNETPLSRPVGMTIGLMALMASLGIPAATAQDQAQNQDQDAATGETVTSENNESADATRPMSLTGSAGGDAAEPSAVTGLADPAVKTAVDFTRDLTDRANAAFTNTDDEARQILAFQSVLNEGLALKLLGRFMLGDSRNDLTEAQQARYDDVFPRYITKLYADQFKDIAGRRLTINDATPFGRRDVIVRTQFFKDDGEAVKVDWRARRFQDGEHKMIDIIVSGVSIMTVKREEFSSFIEANGIDALLDRLETEAVS